MWEAYVETMRWNSMLKHVIKIVNGKRQAVNNIAQPPYWGKVLQSRTCFLLLSVSLNYLLSIGLVFHSSLLSCTACYRLFDVLSVFIWFMRFAYDRVGILHGLHEFIRLSAPYPHIIACCATRSNCTCCGRRPLANGAKVCRFEACRARLQVWHNAVQHQVVAAPPGRNLWRGWAGRSVTAGRSTGEFPAESKWAVIRNGLRTHSAWVAYVAFILNEFSKLI